MHKSVERCEKQGQQPKKKNKERLSFSVPFPSHAFSHTCGHSHVSLVLLNGLRKKRDCS